MSDVFPGSSEMAARMRAFDWSTSTLGAPDEWPESLRTAVRICLTSRFPMILWWGPELRFVYNDAYLPLLGSKHPALGKPGREVWTEIWHIIGPMLDGVLATGEATWSDNMLLPMNRHGYWEETYWTYSYSPLHDDSGTVTGVFTAVNDTTDRVVGTRRMAALGDLGAQAGATTVDEACRRIQAWADRHGADVPYVSTHLGEPADDRWPLAEVMRNGEPVVVAGVTGLPTGGWSTPPTEAMVLPLRSDAGDKPLGTVVLAASGGRALDEDYRAFLRLVADQCATLINGAMAYQAQQRRAEELAALDRSKTVFFSNISHEFRTPLTLITGPLRELREQAPPEIDEQLSMIERNAMRLGKLVNALLDFSRIEAGRVRAHYEPVDLAVLTTELASVFRAAMEKAGLVLEVDCPPLDREGAEKFTPRKLTAATGTSKAGYYSQRIAEYAVEYHNKPVTPCVAMPVKDYLEPEIDLEPVDVLLETWSQEAGDLPALLDAVMDIYGYLPLQAAKRIVQVRGVDLSDIFGIATMSPKFKPAPAVKGFKRDDQPQRGLSPDTRGVWGNIHHVRQPNA